ncbi:MAG: phosphoribosylformylglycinamidine synthase [Erysipelotrichaceae bacterium]|nr:phosphoribosylformylglycinamidine synthase [Erysipelotrichaceae bacterium]
MRRLFITKRKGFELSSHDLSQVIQNQLNLNAFATHVIGYDVFDLDENLLPQAISSVFSEAMCDEVSFELSELKGTLIVKEPLPGQYDQRSDAAIQCLRLLDPSTKASVKTFEAVLFDRELSSHEREIFTHYWINPIEMREKSLTQEIPLSEEISNQGPLKNFTSFNEKEALSFLKENKAAMSLLDFNLIQDFFRTNENRQPTMTEFKVLDTYWSDHCRHTTFETQLSSIEIPSGPYESELNEALELFKSSRELTKRNEKPVTLMEMATIMGRVIDDPRVEHSDEINACSVKIKVNTKEGLIDALLQFKNETHNHPTEIEPFGGASTCIGGAIRDPLSGRAYVYQAMRISGCGNVKEEISETIKDKLPQRVIALRATQGNSAYGNQIGVATTYVKEIYHPKYTAKHLECGAVVGIAKASSVKREHPEENDVIVYLGGRTGRDGIGGATGSSLAHTQNSMTQCASEVQKGNAPEERKLQRLFRNPLASRMIKKANDFGAGGVSVAIGELADGLIIDLDKIPLKYLGLNSTELAISESQERMAVVLDPKDAQAFIDMAHQENIEATIVANVTKARRLQMFHQGNLVVDLDRNLIDTNGVRQSSNAKLTQKPIQEIHKTSFSEAEVLTHLSSLNVALQKGLIERFDGSIGATTVLAPLGGKHQLTSTQGSVQKILLENEDVSTVSILTHGFIPQLSEINPFLGAQGALLQSIAKTIALGGKIENIFFSLQEYFPRLNQDKEKWGSVVSALLGALSVQSVFKRPAIGGKDSMSGSFKDMDVLETLISFACTTAELEDVQTQCARSPLENLYLVKAPRKANGLFDLEEVMKTYLTVQDMVQSKQITGIRVLEESLLESICAMVFGNGLQAEIETKEDLLELIPCAFLISTQSLKVPHEWEKIGKVSCDKFIFNGVKVDYEKAKHAYVYGLDFLYPVVAKAQRMSLPLLNTNIIPMTYQGEIPSVIKVVIPFFPGTNCENDTARAFSKAGGTPVIIGIRNITKEDLEDSLKELVKAIDEAHILALPGGFSSGDEPDGSAKFIVNVLRHKKVKKAVEDLLKRQGLILGICNGFQALIKTGLLPYGQYHHLNEKDATLTHNTLHRHISAIAITRLTSNGSPWLRNEKPGTLYRVPLSHGEGRLKVSPKQAETWFKNGQVAFQYAEESGAPSMDPEVNLNGSDYAIEGLLSPNGQILGKMGHTERSGRDLAKNIPALEELKLFQNGIDYFKKR